jgi:1,4-dihydroxy-2-naphthoate octaprenyltransferase
MEQDSRVQWRILGSAQAVIVFATLIFVIGAIDVVTRAVDPFTKAKLAAWLLGVFVMTLRIVRVLRKIQHGAGERTDAEKMLLQIAAMMPIAGIIPLAFL